MDHVIYRDYIVNRRSVIYCSRACGLSAENHARETTKSSQKEICIEVRRFVPLTLLPGDQKHCVGFLSVA